MKPIKILAFLIVTAAILAAVAMLFPKDGIELGGGIKLHFDFADSQADTVQTNIADVVEIIGNTSAIEAELKADTTTLPADTAVLPQPDTLPAAPAPKPKPARTNRPRSRQPIEFADNDEVRLAPFFAALANCQNRQVRILHYGDSQIEGDRITGYFRNLMQKKYGGSGPGLMPAVPPVAKSSAIVHSASSNWRVHSIYQKRDTSLHHQRFGIMGSFAQFGGSQAWIKFSPSGQAYKSVKKFTQCNIFYGHADSAFTVKGYANGELLWFEDIDPTADTKRLLWNFEQTPTNFRIEFGGSQSPDIYAVTLDSPAGVMVDNLPFRGSKGTEFVKIDLAQMKQMGHYLPVSLIIYEFGVNAVTNRSRSYSYYKENLRKQLQYLKKVWPRAVILVVGVSDMSENGTNGYVTRSSVPKVIEAQRNAAFAEGCAFWNLYAAMGGRNSMPVWVESGMAQKDYTHFNRKGGHRVAQMLFEAIMDEEE
ncbi:MAG: hypothetical protein IKN94_12480 [Salinivirgaceae bacterium]|nr:hypothetical protein [Salinivirgaceae bacterium]